MQEALNTAQQIKTILTNAAINLAAAEEKEQFVVMHETDAYTRGGFFDPDLMIELLVAETNKALDQGYSALRATGEMSWALRGYTGADRLLEYEAKLNRDFSPKYPCLAICQYDRRKFDPEIIKGVVLTHPLLISGNQIYRNFYYIEPEEYLNHQRSEQELRRWLNNLERERQVQESLMAQEEQMRQQNAILLSLIARRTWGEGDFKKAIREITEACARLIQVERVSIWWYNHDYSLIRCLDLYEISKDRHSSDTQLESSIFPQYVACHQRGEIISVTDVQADARTCAIPDTYYGNHNIKSLLDTPIWLHDRVGGLLSFEHVGEQRTWTRTDERLSAAMAALISLSFESSEKKLAEGKLRESEEKYRLLAESADAILWEYDIIADAFTYLAPQVTRILGFAPAEWTDLKFWQKHIHPEDRKWVSQNYADCIKRREDHLFEYRFITKNGEIVWLRDNFNISLLEDQPVKLRGFMIDITERKKAENAVQQLNLELEQRIRSRTAQLETSNRELEAFAYSVSHDLRTPLRAVDGFTQIILEEYGEKLDAEGNRLLRIVLENTQHMDRLIADLLELSRAGRTEIKIVPVDMTKLVHSVINQLTSAEAKERLEYEISSMPVTMADPILVRQVWINLLENALKFSSARLVRRIEIGGCTENDLHIYFIKDNGVGFDPQYAHKLFGIFQRLHSRKDFEGTGIGLAIVQRIVQRHGGQVWAKGAVNEGAIFYFSLPVQPKEAIFSERVF